MGLPRCSAAQGQLDCRGAALAAQQHISDVEFEGPYLRIYCELIPDSSELDSVFDFIKESVGHSQT